MHYRNAVTSFCIAHFCAISLGALLRQLHGIEKGSRGNRTVAIGFVALPGFAFESTSRISLFKRESAG